MLLIVSTICFCFTLTIAEIKASSSKSDVKSCKLPDGSRLTLGDRKLSDGLSYTCVAKAVPFLITNEASDVKYKPWFSYEPKPDAGHPQCIQPNGVKLSLSQFWLDGNVVHKCKLITKAEKFCAAPDNSKPLFFGDTLEINGDGTFRCEANIGDALVLKRQSCFNKLTSKQEPVSAARTYVVDQRNMAKCTEAGQVILGCADRDGQLQEAGAIWKFHGDDKTAAASKNRSVGHNERCQKSSETKNGFSVVLDSCFYLDETLKLNCFYKYTADQKTVSCYNAKSDRYEFLKSEPRSHSLTGTSGQQSVPTQLLCTKEGIQTMLCTDSEGRPRQMGVKWKERAQSDKGGANLGYIRQCLKEALSVAVVTKGCYYEGKQLQVGCGYELENKEHVKCSKSGKYGDVNVEVKLNSLITKISKNCGKLQEAEDVSATIEQH